MDKDHKIWESSDSEFLSFLYAERDRENAMSAAWGINYWVVGAAILGLLGYAYGQISTDYEEFCWQLFTYYAVTLGAVLIAVASISSPPLLQDRWRNKYRVTNIATNFPGCEVFWKGFIAYASATMLLECFKEIGPVTFLHLALSAIEVGVCIYAIAKGEKLVLAEHKGFVFPKIVLELVYRTIEVLICIAIVCTAVYTWGAQYTMHVKEFEMACVLAIIVGIIWVTHSRSCDRDERFLDNLIDKYLYGSQSKENVYFALLTRSQGYDIFDILQREYDKVKPFIDQIKERQDKHTEYLDLIKENKLKYDDCMKYYLDVINERKMASDALKTVEKLNILLHEIIQLDTKTSVIDQVKSKIDEIGKATKDLLNFIQESQKVTRSLLEFINSFICKKYGGLCGTENCKERNEKFSIWYKIKRSITRKNERC